MDTLCASSQTSIACRCRDTMHSTAGSLGSRPRRLKAINDLVVQAAVELGLEDGQKLSRRYHTVVQTRHSFSDRQHVDLGCHRVVTRLMGQLAAALGRRRIRGFRDRTRSARRRMQELQRMTARQRQDQQTANIAN